MAPGDMDGRRVTSDDAPPASHRRVTLASPASPLAVGADQPAAVETHHFAVHIWLVMRSHILVWAVVGDRSSSGVTIL